ncbi:amidohydrolase family protein [Eubacteriales bacterium OttesenSCG-928-M02]|nr:amidohydrolase family protein [Eubacteriales bacterium OttesenSCG-928-M02]
MILKNARIVNHAFQFMAGDVQVKGDRIYEMGTGLTGDEVVDCAGLTLLPGLVDVHTHECIGESLMGCTMEGLARMGKYYGENGITSYYATTGSYPEAVLAPTYETLGRYIQEQKGGAVMRGIHMEGPFFCQPYRGSHIPENLESPNVDMVRRLNDRSGGNIKLVCVAPELPGGMEFVRALSPEMVVSLAHTGATYEEAMVAYGLGAKNTTHLFNGMVGIHHRAPGVIAAALEASPYVEMMTNGIHVEVPIVRMVHRVIGKDRFVMISDSCIATGVEGDTFIREGGQKLEIRENGASYLAGTETLTGSINNLYEMLTFAIQKVGIPYLAAVQAATINPARMMGIAEEVGSIATGKQADILLVDDHMTLQRVYIGGVRIR